MEQTECSETSAYKIQTPGNYPEENIQQFKSLFVKVADASCQLSFIRLKAGVPFSGPCRISRVSKWSAIDCLFVWANVTPRGKYFMKYGTENTVCVREE
jgi:hypothetical protein